MVNMRGGTSASKYYLPWKFELSRFDIECGVLVPHGSEADVSWFVGFAKTNLCCLVKLVRHLCDVVRGPEFGTRELNYRNMIMKVAPTYPFFQLTCEKLFSTSGDKY